MDEVIFYNSEMEFQAIYDIRDRIKPVLEQRGIRFTEVKPGVPFLYNILARKGRLDVGISYVLNGDKTQERVLTAHLNCDPGRECRQMLDTKRAYGKEDGVQYYHIIQSFKPGEVTPEQALEIATEFAKEHLPGYETVIGVHVDREHIHAHLVFNSVNADTGEKYHSNTQSYYQQIRATSDRLCREHGLSIIMEGSSGREAIQSDLDEWEATRRAYEEDPEEQ